MKLLTARKITTFVDPVSHGYWSTELKDPEAWHDNKGNQVIWQKYVRSRAYICFMGVPVYVYKKHDVFLYLYKFWDLPPMYLGPEVKEPGQHLLQLYDKQHSPSSSMLQQ